MSSSYKHLDTDPIISIVLIRKLRCGEANYQNSVTQPMSHAARMKARQQGSSLAPHHSEVLLLRKEGHKERQGALACSYGGGMYFHMCRG